MRKFQCREYFTLYTALMLTFASLSALRRWVWQHKFPVEYRMLRSIRRPVDRSDQYVLWPKWTRHSRRRRTPFTVSLVLIVSFLYCFDMQPLHNSSFQDQLSRLICVFAHHPAHSSGHFEGPSSCVVIVSFSFPTHFPFFGWPDPTHHWRAAVHGFVF